MKANTKTIELLVKVVLISVFFTLSNTAFTQLRISNFTDKFDIDNWKFYAGPAIGPETGVALIAPKFSAFRFVEKPQVEYNLGGEFTPWVAFALMLSTNVSAGIKKGPVSFESSVGVLRYFGLGELDTFSHGTFNPKIGISLGRFWFKGGPSFFLFKDYGPDPPPILDLINISGQSFNFELLITTD